MSALCLDTTADENVATAPCQAWGRPCPRETCPRERGERGVQRANVQRFSKEDMHWQVRIDMMTQFHRCWLAAVLVALLLPGCIWAPLLQNPSLTNYALLAQSTDSLINDDQYETIGTTQQGKPRVFVLQFPEMVRLNKVVIQNYNLFRFHLDSWDSKSLRWKTFDTVKQRRDATGENLTAQPKFVFQRLNVTTDKLRLTVSRTVDDEVIPKAMPDPDDKVVNIEASSSYRLGYYYRVLQEAPAQIREIQVFGTPVK